jgi:hypothetical protein
MSLLSIKSIAPDAELSVAIALHFAKLSLPIWSEAYPNDSRPEDAIKAAEHYVSIGDAAFANAALAAARAAAAAARAAARAADAATPAVTPVNAAAAAARAAARAADAATPAVTPVNAAAYAARAAARAADAAHAGSYAAANAAHAAARAVNATCAKSFIHLELIKQLSGILSYKVENGQSFGEPDAVFENLAESDAKLFLFNLENLR